MSEPRTEAGKRLQTRLAYDRDPASYLPGDFYPEDRDAILAIEAEAALPVPALDAEWRATLGTVAANLLRLEGDAAHLRMAVRAALAQSGGRP